MDNWFDPVCSSHVAANSFLVHNYQKEFGLKQRLKQVNFILNFCGLGILKIKPSILVEHMHVNA